MGQTLSEPVTTKYTVSEQNSNVYVGASSMQGWRINMEDAHTILLELEGDRSSSFYAVFDGHGGAKVAQYAADRLHKKITNSATYKQGRIEDSIREGYLAFDEDMLKDEDYKDELSGSTAVCVLIKEDILYCGNVGDSRGIVSIAGFAKALSQDHKPSNELESKRIQAAGGWVEFNRVNGNLALSRALGDFVFKKNDQKSPQEQIVTAHPDVTKTELTPEFEFLVIACDGIWDVLNNQEVVDFVRARVAQKILPDRICEELMTRCLAPDCQMGGLGCDNMTVVLVCFLNGGTYDELAERCSRPNNMVPNILEGGDAGE